LVEHLGVEPLALAQVQQVGAPAAQLLGGAADLVAELLLAHPGDRRQVHAGDQLLVQRLLELAEPLLGRRGSGGGAIEFGLHPGHRGRRLSSSGMPAGPPGGVRGTGAAGHCFLCWPLTLKASLAMLLDTRDEGASSTTGTPLLFDRFTALAS